MFCQHGLICCVHIPMHGIHQLLYESTCSLPTSSPVYQPSGSTLCVSPWTNSFSCQWCIQSITEHHFTCPSSLSGPLLIGLVCLCVWDCVLVFWMSGRLRLDIFFSTLNLTCFAISDRVNQCDSSTLSCLGGWFYTASLEFFYSSKQRRSGCQQGQINQIKCWQSKSRGERGGGHYRLNVSTWDYI